MFDKVSCLSFFNWIIFDTLTKMKLAVFSVLTIIAVGAPLEYINGATIAAVAASTAIGFTAAAALAHHKKQNNEASAGSDFDFEKFLASLGNDSSLFNSSLFGNNTDFQLNLNGTSSDLTNISSTAVGSGEPQSRKKSKTLTEYATDAVIKTKSFPDFRSLLDSVTPTDNDSNQ